MGQQSRRKLGGGWASVEVEGCVKLSGGRRSVLLSEAEIKVLKLTEMVKERSDRMMR